MTTPRKKASKARARAGEGRPRVRAATPEELQDDAELLAQIFAAPDDDAPRLVYADKLLERGDLRGELIQLQCQAPRLDRHADAEALATVNARVARLQAWGRKVWLTSVRDFIRQWEFRRGFLHSVVADAALFLDGLDALLAQAPELHARLTRIRGDDVLRLAGTAAFRRVTGLNVSGTGIDAAQARVLVVSPNLAGLRALDLGGTLLGPEGIAMLAASPHLARLEQLNIASTGAADAGMRALASSPSFRRLRRLVVLQNGITTDGACAIAESTAFPALEELSFSSDPIGDEALEAFANSTTLPRLRSLQLGLVPMAPEGAVRAIDHATGWPALQELYVSAPPSIDGSEWNPDFIRLELLTQEAFKRFRARRATR